MRCAYSVPPPPPPPPPFTPPLLLLLLREDGEAAIAAAAAAAARRPHQQQPSARRRRWGWSRRRRRHRHCFPPLRRRRRRPLSRTAAALAMSHSSRSNQTTTTVGDDAKKLRVRRATTGWSSQPKKCGGASSWELGPQRCGSRRRRWRAALLMAWLHERGHVAIVGPKVQRRRRVERRGCNIVAGSIGQRAHRARLRELPTALRERPLGTSGGTACCWAAGSYWHLLWSASEESAAPRREGLATWRGKTATGSALDFRLG